MYVSSVSLMCALKLMRSGSPLGELAAQQTEGGGIRREYGLSLLVLLILLNNDIVIFPEYVLSVSLMCALKLMRSGSPLGELAAQQTEGGGIRREYGLSLLVLLIVYLGLSLLVLLIVYLIPFTPLSPLRGALPEGEPPDQR